MNPDPLDLVVPQQSHTNWCWAATTVGVHGFVFENTGADPLTQCFVVDRRLGSDHCCVEPDAELPKECNVQSGLTLPLHEADCHVVTYANRIDLNEIKDQIDQCSPVGVRVVWEQGFGEGHFAVIVGYADDPETGIRDLIVEDSLYGRSTQTYESFRKYYRTSVQNPDGLDEQEGRWTHTYFIPPQEPDDRGSGSEIPS